MAKKKDEAEVQAEPKDRLAALLCSEVLEKIKKTHGAEIVVRASDQRAKLVQRIPTGIFPLDYALGGGFPAGFVNVVFGKKSASKTTTLLKVIAQAQKMCSACWTVSSEETGTCACGELRDAVVAYIDVEGTFDNAWAATHGVDLNRMLLSKPEYAEQSLDIADALVRSGKVDVLVLDSIAFLTPMKEIEESAEKDLMGTQPRLVGKGIRKLASALNLQGNETGFRPTVFLTNQIRMKLGVMYGNPETQPGGVAPGFAAVTEVKMWHGKFEMDEDLGRPLWVDMNFKVEKNKSAPANMEGTYRLILSDSETKKIGDVYDEDSLMSMGTKLGLIEGGGPRWTALGEEFGAKSQIERKLLIDPAFKKKFRATLLSLLIKHP